MKAKLAGGANRQRAERLIDRPELARVRMAPPFNVSLDSDNQEWKEFIGKYEMTWPHYRGSGFTGPISLCFARMAIPHTFTIDSNGVLEEEHLGDATNEGKLREFIPRAHELQNPQTFAK